MGSFLTYSDMKNKPIRAKIRLSKLGTAVMAIIILLLVGFAGNYLLDRNAKATMNTTAEQAVLSLLNEGTYESIKPYVKDGFLGELSEADYDFSAKQLTELKGSTVESLNVNDNSVFGTIRPTGDSTESYLFGYFVTFEKSGLNDYKITDIVTDYGRDSFFEAP